MSRYLKHDEYRTNGNSVFTILQDDRERNPWSFLSDRWDTEVQRLKTGDYTIAGYEDQIAIEKKSGISEILMDLTARKRPAFKRFLERLSMYPVKCIVVEEELTSDNIYRAVALAKKKSHGRTKLTPETIFYWTSYIPIWYGISMIWTDRRTSEVIVPKMFEMAYKKVRTL